MIIDLYENNSLKKYLDELNTIEKNDNLAGWTSDERILLKILKTK
jgi:DNA topoisomerase-1